MVNKLVGGFNPFEKYARQIGSLSPGRGENNKYLKPPPRSTSGSSSSSLSLSSPSPSSSSLVGAQPPPYCSSFTRENGHPFLTCSSRHRNHKENLKEKSGHFGTCTPRLGVARCRVLQQETSQTECSTRSQVWSYLPTCIIHVKSLNKKLYHIHVCINVCKLIWMLCVNLPIHIVIQQRGYWMMFFKSFPFLRVSSFSQIGTEFV